MENRDELSAVLTAATQAHTTRGLWELLGEHAVPAAPIQDMADVTKDPQVEASGMLSRVDHPEIPNYRDVAIPLRWDDERPQTRTVPPRAGEHTREVMAELGYGPDEIEKLLADGVLAA